jgi:hypothetical protein
MCDLCADAGTLRDGHPCPRCSLPPTIDRGGATVVLTETKRIVWLRPKRTISPAHQKPRGNQWPQR